MDNFKKLFFSISFSEFCSRLSYYGLQALLVLYLVNHLGLSMKASYTLYGNYTALTFAYCIIGGIVADKFLTQYQSVFLGVLLTLSGNLFLLLSSTVYLLYFGVSLLIIGVGLVKPGTSCLAGMIGKDSLRIKGKIFLYFYTISSAGGILGPLLYGIGIASGKYWIGFFSSSIILVINALLFLSSIKNFKNIEERKQPNYLLAIILLFLTGTAVYLTILSIISIYWLFLLALTIAILFLVFSFLKKPSIVLKAQTSIFFTLSFPLIASVIFFVVLLQVYSSVTIFIEHTFNNSIFGWSIPITWFSSIEAFLLLIITPFLTSFWRFIDLKKINITPQDKILIGFIMTSIAFFMFALSAYVSSLGFLFIVFANLFLAIGELSIIPISLLLISNSAPAKYQGILMGIFYFLLSFSGYLAGLLAKAAPENFSLSYNYVFFFLNIAFSLLVFTLFLFGLKTCLKESTAPSKSLL